MNSKLVGHDELTVLHCNCNLTDDVAIDNSSSAVNFVAAVLMLSFYS